MSAPAGPCCRPPPPRVCICMHMYAQRGCMQSCVWAQSHPNLLCAPCCVCEHRQEHVTGDGEGDDGFTFLQRKRRRGDAKVPAGRRGAHSANSGSDLSKASAGRRTTPHKPNGGGRDRCSPTNGRRQGDFPRAIMIGTPSAVSHAPASRPSVGGCSTPPSSNRPTTPAPNFHGVGRSTSGPAEWQPEYSNTCSPLDSDVSFEVSGEMLRVPL